LILVGFSVCQLVHADVKHDGENKQIMEQKMDNMEKELENDFQMIEKIMHHGNRLKKFPTIRIIRNGPIHIGNISQQPSNSIFEEENFIGPEIGSRRVFLNKKRNHFNSFPMMLGPFPNMRVIPFAQMTQMMKGRKDEHDDDAEEDIVSHKKKQNKKKENFEKIDKQLENRLDEFLFGGMKSMHTKQVHHELPGVVEDLNLPALLPTESRREIDKEIDELVKKNIENHHHQDQERFKQVEKPKVIPTIQPTEHKAESTHESHTQENKESDKSVHGSSISFESLFSLAKSNKSMYIPIGVLLLLVLSIMILCYLISSRKEAKKNNKESKFLDDMNSNSYF